MSLSNPMSVMLILTANYGGKWTYNRKQTQWDCDDGRYVQQRPGEDNDHPDVWHLHRDGDDPVLLVAPTIEGLRRAVHRLDGG